MSEPSHPPVQKQGTDPLTVFDPVKVEPDLRAMTRLTACPHRVV